MMRNYLNAGPLRVRISTKHLAPWGYAMIGIGGLSLLSRSSNGGMILASYHPRRHSTWLWSVSVRRGQGKSSRATRRSGQWLDYYRLPFGLQLMVAMQDFHKRKRAA